MGKVRIFLAALTVAAVALPATPALATHACMEDVDRTVCDAPHTVGNKVDGFIGFIFCKYSSSC